MLMRGVHFNAFPSGLDNAGKTTILKKVCNSIEDPEIYSPSGEKASIPSTVGLIVCSVADATHQSLTFLS